MRIKRKKTAKKLGMIGKIKTGKKHPQKGYPMALDYFRFTSNFKQYEAMAIELFGQTNSLKVTFASDDTDYNCMQRLELRDNGGRLAAYTDLQNLWVSGKDGFDKVSEERINKGGGIDACIKAMESKYKSTFQEVLVLRVMLLGFPVLGTWEITTKGSKSSIQNIIDVYDLTMENAGRVQFMPFTLNLQLVKSNRVGVNRKYPVLSLLPDLSIQMQEEIKSLGNNISGLVTSEKIKQLSSKEQNLKTEDIEYEEMN